MSYVQRAVIPVLTDGSGNATAYSEALTGTISTLRYVKTDFADGVDFTITLEATGETVWTEADVNASATKAPRQATHSVAGAAALYAAGGAAVLAPIAMAGDRLKIVVASGGAAKTGTFHLVLA